MSEPSWALSIDFGTTNTTAAMITVGGTPEVLEVENSRYLPSAVFAAPGGELQTGRNAVRQGVVFPDRIERAPKRALARQSHVLLGGERREAVDLVAAVLGRVYGEAVRFHGVAPDRVVLTHPARWGAPLLDRLQAAASRAGLPARLDLVPEPVAAAWWYARPEAGQLLAVFDLGGGTLDTAVLRARETGFELAGAPGGDPDLGGEDFDDLLFTRVSDLARERDGAAWQETFRDEGPRAVRDRAFLRADVTAAKEALSEHLTYELAVLGYAEGFRLTRAELDGLVGPAIDGAATELRRTIAAAGATDAEVTGLYLTGGASRMPVVATHLARAVGVEPRLRDDPKAAVALGALVYVPPPSDEELLATAKALLDGYRFAEAADAYRSIIQARPALTAAQVGLGSVMRMLGQDAEAERLLRAAVAAAPADAGAWRGLSRALSALDRYPEAEEAAREAMRLDPDAVASLLVLGRALSGLDRLDEAEKTFQAVLKSGDPEVIDEARLLLGLTLLRAKRDPQAPLREVLGSRKPHQVAAAHLGLAIACAQAGDLGGAREHLEQAVKSPIPQAAARASLLLGGVLAELGDVTAARPLLQQAVTGGDRDLAKVARGVLAELDEPFRALRELSATPAAVLMDAQFSLDGRIIAGVGLGGTVRLWNAATGELIRGWQVRLRGKGILKHVVFDPDGLNLATVGGESRVRLWTIGAGAANGVMGSHDGEVYSAAFSPDGTLLATGAQENVVRVWHLATAKCVLKLEGHSAFYGVEGVAFNPHGRLLATVDRRLLRIWDVTTGRCVRRIATGHTAFMRGTTFSPDGSLIATCSKDGTARLWRTTTGELIRVLTGHADQVTGVAFSPDGRLLATSSQDATARIWAVATGAVVKVIGGHKGWVMSVSWSADGSTLATCDGGAGVVRLWRRGSAAR